MNNQLYIRRFQVSPNNAGHYKPVGGGTAQVQYRSREWQVAGSMLCSSNSASYPRRKGLRISLSAAIRVHLSGNAANRDPIFQLMTRFPLFS